MQRISVASFLQLNYFILPGLSWYPPVKIADRNAKQTPKIRTSLIRYPPVSSVILCPLYRIEREKEITDLNNCDMSLTNGYWLIRFQVAKRMVRYL